MCALDLQASHKIRSDLVRTGFMVVRLSHKCLGDVTLQAPAVQLEMDGHLRPSLPLPAQIMQTLRGDQMCWIRSHKVITISGQLLEVHEAA